MKKSRAWFLLLLIVTSCSLNIKGNESNVLVEHEPNEDGCEEKIPVRGEKIHCSISGGDPDIFWFYGEYGKKYTVIVEWVSGEDLYFNTDWYANNSHCFWSYRGQIPREKIVDTINMGFYSGKCYLRIGSRGIGEYTISVLDNSINMPE